MRKWRVEIHYKHDDVYDVLYTEDVLNLLNVIKNRFGYYVVKSIIKLKWREVYETN
jgi:hypothetical protein